MLGKRLIASFLLICPVLAFFWLDANRNFGHPGIWAIPVVSLFSMLIAGELQSMLRGQTAGAIPWVSYAGAFLCQFAVVLPELMNLAKSERWTFSMAAMVITLLLAFAHELLCFSEERESTTRVALTLFTVAYSGWLLIFLAAVRLDLPNYKGAVALFSVLFIIKMSDTGAYFTGKQFGKHKLAPILSPGKTVEGGVGGMVAALLAAAIVFGLIMPQVTGTATTNWWAAMGYGLSIGLVGIVGDLSESLIKRDMGRKDSSDWLPGLGGIMDTADSVILAAPVAYLWWRTGLL